MLILITVRIWCNGEYGSDDDDDYKGEHDGDNDDEEYDEEDDDDNDNCVYDFYGCDADDDDDREDQFGSDLFCRIRIRPGNRPQNGKTIWAWRLIFEKSFKCSITFILKGKKIENKFKFFVV